MQTPYLHLPGAFTVYYYKSATLAGFMDDFGEVQEFPMEPGLTLMHLLFAAGGVQ